MPVFPAAEEVQLRNVEPGVGGRARVLIAYRRGFDHGEGTVVWNGERFMAVSPPPATEGSLEAALSRIERALFERRDYRGTLRALERFTDDVRASHLSPTQRLVGAGETLAERAVRASDVPPQTKRAASTVVEAARSLRPAELVFPVTARVRTPRRS
jgi:hypothetical protein